MVHIRPEGLNKVCISVEPPKLENESATEAKEITMARHAVRAVQDAGRALTKAEMEAALVGVAAPAETKRQGINVAIFPAVAGRDVTCR